MHEITAGHRSLSGTISCVIDRIRFLPVSMTGSVLKFQKFIIYRGLARIVSDRDEVLTARHDVWHWRDICFRH